MGFSVKPSASVLWIVGALIGLGAANESATAQQESTEKKPATNLEIIRLLSQSAAARTFQQTPAGDSGKVQISVFPKDVAWLIEGGILEAARSYHLVAAEAGRAAYQVSFGMDEARVVYSNIRRDGLFGPKLVDRTVRLRLSSKIVDGADGRILRVADIEESMTDTIRVTDIPEIENPVVPFTKGSLPREGFFTSLAEPLIVVGSVAIAVLLLFNVRS